MSEKIRDVAEAVKGIVEAVPVYQDVVQPAAREIGIALQTVAKTVHIALAPVSALVWGYDELREFVSTKVAGKLQGVPVERIVSPKPNVAGPALEALRYTGHEETLRDLYANLLAASMDSATAKGAHPAFVDIIRQLTPDEARLIGHLSGPAAFPLLDVRWEYKVQTETEQGGQTVFTNFSLLGEAAACEVPTLTPTYIDNICRLGLAAVPQFFRYTRQGYYKPLEQHPTVRGMKEALEADERIKVRLERKGLVVTPLGRQFCAVCVLAHGVSIETERLQSIEGPRNS